MRPCGVPVTCCVIYTRFSPRRNAEESESAETQEAQCREHAALRPWEVRAVFSDEAKSGDDPERPGLAAAIAALRRGDVLLAYRRDRIARSVLVSELVRRQVAARGARIAAVYGEVAGSEDESPEAVLVRQVLDAVAEFERKLIGARTSASMRTQQRGGKRVSKHPPYGWAVDPADPARLVQRPEEQAVCARVRKLASEGLGVRAILRKLAEEGARPRGKAWSCATVSKIMTRTA